MKCKIIKHISGPTFTSWNAGDIVDVDYGFPILVSDGIKIGLSELIEQGFIEEVKETPKPKWKLGDNIVQLNNDSFPNYSQVQSIFFSEVEQEYFYNHLREKYLRDPTEEELSIYFR